MRITLSYIAAFAAAYNAHGFAPSFSLHQCGSMKGISGSSSLSMVDSTEDCGCATTIMSGKPSEKAKDLDLRKAIAESPFYDIDGNVISSMDDILQYSKRREDLLANEKNIQLVIVSIGKPEVGKKVSQHLGLNYDDAKSFIFCDPENALYDDLDLNRGLQTFIAPDTAFSFRDRIFNQQKTGLNDLFSVLSNWKDAIYIPPKAEQAFNQGGAFLFDGPNTIFAHYDASTGAHVDVNEMIQISLSTDFSEN